MIPTGLKLIHKWMFHYSYDEGKSLADDNYLTD